MNFIKDYGDTCQKISMSAKVNLIFLSGTPDPKSLKRTGKEGIAL
jgi:hypothetical protein